MCFTEVDDIGRTGNLQKHYAMVQHNNVWAIITHSQVSDHPKVPQLLDHIIQKWEWVVVMPGGCSQRNMKDIAEVPI